MALFAHCFTCSKDLFAAGRIAAELMAAGLGVLRFDFAGLGASEGDFEDTNFSSNQADLVAAADWLRANHSPPQLLIGHSLGGAAVLSVAGAIEGVRAVATIGAPADAAHVTNLFADELPAIAREGCRYVQISGRTFPVRQEFIDDLLAQSVADRVAAMHLPLLVLHSPIDNTVGVENAGPAPYDMLAAALGACTSMTLRMYAQRKQLALDRVTVEVRHQKRHADDCLDCVDGKGALNDHFDQRLLIEGELSDSDRESLANIADRCPVHRTLEASSRIVTTVG